MGVCGVVWVASQMADTVNKAQKEHAKMKATLRRPVAAEPSPKRGASPASPAVPGGRRFRVMKSWSAKKQPASLGRTYMPVQEGDLVIAVGEVDMDATFVEESSGQTTRSAGTCPSSCRAVGGACRRSRMVKGRLYVTARKRRRVKRIEISVERKSPPPRQRS